MAQQIVNADLVTIALEHVEGMPFERFVNAFYPEIAGVSYVPLGGVHDGGADGLFSSGLTESPAAQGVFLQASVQENHRDKIRGTVRRLRDFGRVPTSLTYVTSRVIPHIDREEEDLARELGLTVRIRDRRYIASQINTTNTTVAAFEHYLRPYLSFLNIAGNVPIVKRSEHVQSPAAYVFLRQEVERRLGNSSLLEAVADALILWSLEGTDPDRKIFMTREQILTKIETAVPPAKHFMRGIFDHRINIISSKQNASGREVRWHRKEDLFCLPYETRLLVEDENVQDEAARIRMLDGLVNRIASAYPETTAENAALIAKTTVRAFQITFERKGIEFSAFLHADDSETVEYSMADSVDVALDEAGVYGEDLISFKEIILRMMHACVYESSIDEREYLSKLCRTYLLLFSINAEPRIVEYFQSMASDFYLYVGSDILVHTLSERCLNPEDRMTTHLLEMLSQAGATLVLAEPELDEVHSNLEISDWEFINHFAEFESYMTVDLARHASKILIRSYFYAKLDPVNPTLRPKGWRSYIEQFCSYKNLHNAAGKAETKDYFLNKFDMKFESTNELMALCDHDLVDELAARMEPDKKNDILARNDAILVYATYGRRIANGEISRTTRFGYNTWWLTHQSRVRQYTHDIFRKTGSHYIIRPEFLLNFISLSPSVAEVRIAYQNVFPTLLGVKLSGRLDERTFHELLDKAKEASNMEEPRLRALMASLSNQLKGDFYKQYQRQAQPGPPS